MHPIETSSDSLEGWIAEFISLFLLKIIILYDDYVNPLNAFLEAMLKKLNGGKAFYFTKNFSLDNFTTEELEQPHMQWITLFTNRYNQLKADGYGRKAFRLSRSIPATTSLTRSFVS